MTSEEGPSNQERQEDELQVLQSIYGDDVVDLRTKAAWNAWQPVKTKLKLYPQESQGPHSQVFAQVEMVITCPSRYPDVIPTIELQNGKNVPDVKLGELKKELIDLAKQSLGEVMIMELAERVREFLHIYNKPPAKSFHEQMLDKQKAAEAERAQRQQEQQERERRRREEEMRQVEAVRRRRQQELIEERNETRSKKGVTPPLTEEQGRSPSAPLTSTLSPIIASPQVGTVQASLASTPTCPAVATATRRQRRTSTPRRTSESEADEGDGRAKGAAVCTLVFSIRGQEERQVQRGKQQQSQGGGGSTVYCGLDQSTGEAVAITEWIIKWRTVAKKSHFKAADLDEDKEGLDYLSKVKSIEQEALTLIRLSHPNIIRYLGFRYQREPGKITVHLLSEYCGGSNLGVNLRNHKPVPLETLRHHTEGMLQALHYLHDHTVVHKLFRASCVFVDNQGKVRLADYAIDKRLRELYREIDTVKSRVKFEDSTDRMPPTFGRSNKKGDIYQLGVTVLALSIGDYITDTVPIIPSSLPPPLADFLNRCLVRDDRQRWCTSQLLDHPFLKQSLTLSISPPSPAKPGANKEVDGNNRDDSDNEADLIEYRTSMERSGKSRLTQEFHVEKTLGKGGFGDVLKVKNKLDGQVYAIKRIMINPRSKQLSQKITREVNLLSRLNHENIVRYYNAWMEFTDDPALSETSSVSTLSSRPSPSPASLSSKQTQPAPTIKRKNSLEMFDDIEELAPQIVDGSTDWSVSRSMDTTDQKSEDEIDSSDDDFEEDGGHWGIGGIGASFLRWSEQTDDSVGFETEDGSPSSEDQQTTDSASQAGTPKKCDSKSSSVLWAAQPAAEEEPPRLRCLYIQMQYCEKSTLRRAIDHGLSQNMDRVWRYFREITEGLLYIHEQNMIHRDLKPVNIFLDSNDLVKIGDFGLATTDIVKQKTGLADSTLATPALVDPFTSSRSGTGSGDGDMTGEVGTALYVSPEMMKGGSNLCYGQKVDIYSLGIIFFEMVYRPLSTNMERFMVLSNLRKEQILFPNDFDSNGLLRHQAELIQQMLNHNPSQRPSSKELLQSPHLPAVQEAEAEFQRRMEEAINNPESHIYRRVLAQLFSQQASTLMDMTYNMDQTKTKNVKIHNPVRSSLLKELATERVEKVFKCHGAVRLNTPLLMPRPKQYSAIQQLLACFLDKSGAVVNLPFDLRLPFARYVAHNSILNLKRYSIERVYRQMKVQSLHPSEVIECAFDIVTSTRKSVIPEAQLLTVVEQVIDQFPVLQSRPYEVCMNHTKLIEAVLLNAGVPVDKLSPVVETLVAHQTITEDTIRMTMKHHQINLTAAAEAQLKAFLDTEAELSVVSSKLRPLTRQHNHVGHAAKEGLHELESIQSTARDLGLKMKIMIGLCLVYNLRQHSGLIFQVYYKKQHKKQKARELPEIIASGGRYDKLVSEFSPGPLEQRAAGVSIAFDIVLAALLHETELVQPNPCDVMVCTVGHKPMIKERLQITRTLLAASIRTEVQYEALENIEELQDKCRAAGIPFLVILKDSREKEGDGSFVRVKMLETKGSGTEKRVNVTDLVEYIQPKLAANKADRETQDSATASGGGGNSGGGGGGGSNSGSRNSEQENVAKSSSGPRFIFTYASKMSGQARRRIELSVCNKAPKWLTGDTEVVVAELPEQAIRTIQAFIELNKEDTDFDKSVAEINEKLSRHRKYLQSVMDHIREIRFENKRQHLLLYGTKEDTLRLLT